MRDVNYKNRVYYMLEGMAGNAVSTLFAGTFLAGMLDCLGVPTGVSAVLLQISLFVAPVQLFSPIFTEKRETRLGFFRCCFLLNRTLILAAGLISMLALKSAAAGAFLSFALLAAHLVSAFGTPANTEYLASIVPPSERTSYIGIINPVMLLFAAVFSFLMSFVLDHFKAADDLGGGFTVIFAVAVGFLILDYLFMFRLRESGAKYERTSVSIRDVFTRPLKDRFYRRFVGWSVVYNASIQFANAFFTLYLVSTLRLPYWYMTALGIFANLVRAAMGKALSRFAPDFPPRRLVAAGATVLAATYITWAFIGGGNYKILLPIVNATAGMGLCAADIANFSLNVDSAPLKNRSIYFSFHSCVTFFAGFLASLAGARINSLISEIPFVAQSGFSSMRIMFALEGVFMAATVVLALLLLPKKPREQ